MKIAFALAAGMLAIPAPVSAQERAGSWYWCDAARGYYPQVSSCPGGWREVPVQVPVQPPQRSAPVRTPEKPQQVFDISGWAKVEADNGQMYRVDTHSVQESTVGTVAINVYVDDGGLEFVMGNFKTFIFDCRGHFQEAGSPGTMSAPPKSVAGRIGSLACSAGRPSR